MVKKVPKTELEKQIESKRKAAKKAPAVRLSGLGEGEIKKMLPFLSTEETRAVLQNIGIQGEWAYATDGHKAIKIRHERLGEGFVDGLCYEVTTSKRGTTLVPQDDEVAFPNCETVMKVAPREGETLETFDGMTGDAKDSVNLSTLMFKLARRNACIDYLAIKALPKSTSWKITIQSAKGLSPVSFWDGDTMQAVLMPIRTSEHR